MVNEAVATAKGDIYKMDPVKLIAADGSEIILDRRAANVSGTIKNMLSGPGNFSEAQQGEVKFPEISARVLEKTAGLEPAAAVDGSDGDGTRQRTRAQGSERSRRRAAPSRRRRRAPDRQPARPARSRASTRPA